MKKKILSIAFIIILAAISVSGTLAYYTSKEQSHNVITTDGVGIQLIEKTEIETNEGTRLADFPKAGISGVMPGSSVSKIVSVENTGSAEAWIRIKVEMQITNQDGDEMPMEFDLPQTTEKENIPVIIYHVNEEDWLYEGEHYYYRYPVESGKHTRTLFEEVVFSKNIGNDYQDCTINIMVSAQAVQIANNLIPAGGNHADIKGWPKK